MLKKILIITGVIAFAAVLAAGCFFSKDEEDDKLPCMCFQNDSSYTATGIRYKLSTSSSWTYSTFDESVGPYGDGFDCAEGTFKVAVAAGTYDFEILYSGGTIRHWSSVSYDGGNIGFWITSSSSTSVCGAVDGACNQAGTAYYASY